MQRQWDGLTLFLDFPEVPLDNNECERLLRTPVVGRKNFYGSGARWSGELAAMLWTHPGHRRDEQSEPDPLSDRPARRLRRKWRQAACWTGTRALLPVGALRGGRPGVGA